MEVLEKFTSGILSKTNKPRYQMISELISQKIDSGSLIPGELLPSENEFANLFDVSKNTVVRAIIDLKNQGIIERHQGKGTFVAKSAKVNSNNMISILMRTTGHLFSDISSNLIRSIQETNYYPLIIDPFSCENIQVFRKKLDRLLDTHPPKIIADGDVDFPFDLLKCREDDFEQITFINRLETPDKFIHANSILSDYFSGGYQIINHFLDNGWEDCALFTYYNPPAETPSMPQNKIHKDMLNGCHSAFIKRGLDPQKHLQIIYDIKGEEPLRKVLKSSKRPRAIFAFGDMRAKHIFDIAEEIGLEIPDDLAVAGYYNTPWVNMFKVPLTSVSICLKEICDIAVALAGDSVNHINVNKIIKPKLIIRKSTEST